MSVPACPKCGAHSYGVKIATMNSIIGLGDKNHLCWDEDDILDTEFFCKECYKTFSEGELVAMYAKAEEDQRHDPVREVIQWTTDVMRQMMENVIELRSNSKALGGVGVRIDYPMAGPRTLVVSNLHSELGFAIPSEFDGPDYTCNLIEIIRSALRVMGVNSFDTLQEWEEAVAAFRSKEK
jgi:hypothetical protein